jgi:hypothetical protein
LEVRKRGKREGVRRKSRLRGNQKGREEVRRLLGGVEGKENSMYPLMKSSSTDDHFLQKNISTERQGSSQSRGPC